MMLLQQQQHKFPQSALGSSNTPALRLETYLSAALMLGMRSAQAADISMLADMGKYMNLAGGSNDSVHAPITNIIWWCWNANSAQAQCACRHRCISTAHTVVDLHVQALPCLARCACMHILTRPVGYCTSATAQVS